MRIVTGVSELCKKSEKQKQVNVREKVPKGLREQEPKIKSRHKTKLQEKTKACSEGSAHSRVEPARIHKLEQIFKGTLRKAKRTAGMLGGAMTTG